MYHTIQFSVDVMVDLGISHKDRLELLLIKQGTRRQAQVRPYVAETENGPVETADLFFEDGTSAAGLPFECFAFVD